MRAPRPPWAAPRRRPFPPRRSRLPRLGPRGQGRAAVAWLIAFVALAAGYQALAPVADDYRSSLRAMSGFCTVARVVDGDTVDLRCLDRGDLVRARLVGFDAPELFSPQCPAEADAADRSRRALQSLVDRAWRTEVAFLGADRYGRALVDMRLDGQRVATLMVENGHAVRYLGGWRGGWC